MSAVDEAINRLEQQIDEENPLNPYFSGRYSLEDDIRSLIAEMRSAERARDALRLLMDACDEISTDNTPLRSYLEYKDARKNGWHVLDGTEPSP